MGNYSSSHLSPNFQIKIQKRKSRSEMGLLNTLQLLRTKAIDVNKVDHNSITPLFLAVQNGHVKVVELLLKVDGIQCNGAAKSGSTPLLVAAFLGNAAIVELLLRKEDIQVNKAGYGGVTPLLIAAEKGHEKVVKLLLNREDIRVSQARIDGHTPMAMAWGMGHNKVAELLKRKLREPLDDDSVCIVCLDRRPDVVLIPCGHKNMCRACARQWKKEQKGCPVDRTWILDILKLLKRKLKRRVTLP